MKKITTTVILGGALVGSAVMAQEAHAAETETPKNDSNLVVKTEVGKTTEADVAKEKQKADEAKKSLELEKKEADKKVELAKKDSEKVNKLEKDAEEGSNVTDKVIDEKADEIKKLESNKDNVATEINKSKSEVDIAKKDTEDKEKVAKEKEENSSSIDKNLKSKQSEEASLLAKLKEDKNKLNTLTESLNKIEKDKEKSEKALEEAQAALNKAKEEEAENLNKIKQLEAKRDEQQAVLNNKQKQLENAKAEKEKIEDEIKKNEAIFGVKGVLTEIKFDPEFVKALKEYTNADPDTQVKLLNGVIAKEDEAVKKYPILNTDSIDYSNSEKVDINNLSEKDQILLTQYFNHLNNQVRKQFGLAPAKTNLNVLKFAQDIAKFTKESGYQDTHHDNRSINRAALKNGIDKTDKGTAYNRFESLDFNTIDKDKSKGNMVARQFLFDSIYQSVQRFYHEGGMNRHYLHAEHMLNTNDETFGTYFVMTPSKSEYYNWVRFGVVGVNKWYGFTGYDDNGPTYNKFDKEWGYKSPQTIDLIQVKDVSALKDKLATAKSTVTTLQAELDKATGELTKRENELKAVESQPSTVAEATKALQDAKVARDIKVAELAKAEKELKDIQDIIDNEQTQAKTLRDELVKANDEVAKAEVKSAKAKAELVEAQKLEEQAKQAMKSLTDELDRLTNEIAKAESEKAELVTLKAEYTENVKLLATAKEDLEVSRALVSEAMVELADLQKDATEKFDEYLKVKRQYDMENLTWAVTKDTPVFELPEFDIKELDKLSQPSTQKPSTKVPSTKVTTTKTNAQAPKFGKASAPKATVKSDERKLPNTGDTTTDLAGFGIVSMLMASYAMTMRRRENEK